MRHLGAWRKRVGLRLALAVAGGAALAASAGAQIVGTVQYRAPGVRNGGVVATVVSCTNVGATADDVSVEFLDADGASVCTLTAVDAPAGSTSVFATRPAQLYPGAVACSETGPTLSQGVVLLGGDAEVRCSVLLLGIAETPSFTAALEIYRAD